MCVELTATSKGAPVGVNECTEVPKRSKISILSKYATNMCVELDVKPVGAVSVSNLNRNSVDSPYANAADPNSEIIIMPKMAFMLY